MESVSSGLILGSVLDQEQSSHPQSRPGCGLEMQLLAAEVLQLPSPTLVHLLARAFCFFPDMRREAEAHLIQRHPCFTVLQSVDLVSLILGRLRQTDWSAAAVCKVWRHSWQLTVENRRWLRCVPARGAKVGGKIGGIAVLAGAQQWLAVSVRIPRGSTAEHCIEIRDRQLQHVWTSTLQGLVLPGNDGDSHETLSVASGENGLYVWQYQFAILNHYHVDTGSLVLAAQYECTWPSHFSSGLIVHGGLIYVTTYSESDNELGPVEGSGNVMVLDAQALVIRRRFGDGFLQRPHGLAEAEGSIYVCDNVLSNGGNLQGEGVRKHFLRSRLQVFSLTGEHAAEMRGDDTWRELLDVKQMHRRLYVVESAGLDFSILVLTLDGTPLQVFRDSGFRMQPKETCAIYLAPHLVTGSSGLLVVGESDRLMLLDGA